MRNVIRNHPSALRALGALLLLGFAAVLTARAPHLIQSAFGVGKPSKESASAVSKISSVVKNLDSDALPFMAAIVPLAIVVGAASLMVGSRRGMAIIGSAVGALIVVAAIGGIAA